MEEVTENSYAKEKLQIFTPYKSRDRFKIIMADSFQE